MGGRATPSLRIDFDEVEPRDRWRIESALESALLYRSVGWAPLPCCWPDAEGHCACSPGDPHEDKAAGKAPLIRGHIPATWLPAEKEIIRWWEQAPEANVALALEPSGLICVDLDGADGVATATSRGLPRTPTARRGEHLHVFFKRPDGVPATRAVNKEEQIDVLAAGIVVMPPSLHREQDRYEWLITPDEADLALPPAWVVEILQASAQARLRAAVVPTGPRREPPAWVWDALQDEAASYGGDRSRAVWAIICCLVEYDWTDEQIIAELQNYPWTARDKRNPRKYWSEEITRARRKTAGDSEPEKTGGAVGSSGFMPIIDLDPTPPEWVVEDLIPAGGITLISGRPKLGKSTLCRQLAACVALGRDFLGHRIVRPGKVLYVVGFGEGRPSAVRNAFLLQGVSNQVLAFFETCDVERLAAGAYEHRPTAIFLDTMGKVLLGRDFDSYKEMGTAIQPVADLARRWNLALVVLHHDRKGDGSDSDDPTSEVLGSTQITGSSEVVLSLRRKGKRRVLGGVGRETGEIDPLVLDFDKGKDIYRVKGSLSDVERGDAEDAILDWAAEFAEEMEDGGWFTSATAASELGIGKRTIQRALNSLVDAGAIEAQGFTNRRKYRLVVRGQDR